MFDKLTAMLGGDRPSGALRDALRPIAAHSEDLFQRCVGFVHAGTDPVVLTELHNLAGSDLDDLLMQPGQLIPWPRTSQPGQLRLGRLGISRTTNVAHYRDLLYRSASLAPEQWIRLGRVLAEAGKGPNRTAQGVPDWLVALVNDVLVSAGSHNKGDVLAKLRSSWTPDLLARLLAVDGMPHAAIPAAVVLVLFQVDGHLYGRNAPYELPGVAEFLTANGRWVPPDGLGSFTAAAKVNLAEWAAKRPAVGAAIVHVLARFSVDGAKTARSAAIAALAKLPWEAQRDLLRDALTAAPATRARELLTYLSHADEGAAVLAEARAAGAKATDLIDKAGERVAALAEAAPVEAETPLGLPDYPPVRASSDPARLTAGVRRFLDKQLANATSENRWVREQAAKARGISDADIADFVARALGEHRRKTKIESTYAYYSLLHMVPELSLVEALRLLPPQSANYWAIRDRVDPDTDLRHVEDAFRVAGHPTDEVHSLIRGGALTPAAKWPWLAQHPDLAQQWLTAGSERAIPVLEALAHFPRIPASLAPTVAGLALGEAKVTRRLAQRALAQHPAARSLAEQGLGDGKGEIRATAADWLASIGDPAAVPALRAALKKESREVVRASLLTALETLGDDISADLSPTTLLAEARKGLRAKPPASMSWFPLDQLPAVQWANGTPVEPDIVRWWVVLADKLKTPDGSGLLDRYLSLLETDDAAALGSFVLRSWIAQDTQGPDEAASRAYAATEGPQRYQRAQQWLTSARQDPRFSHYLAAAEEAARVPLETHVANAFREHQGFYLGSAVADKGLLALTTRVPGIELANAVQGYIRNHGSRRAQVDTLVHTLAANGQDAATQLLLGISRRFKQASVQATAARLVEELADRRGWTADELADRTIPAAGFAEDGLLHLGYGPREFLGRLSAAGTIELTNPEGAVVKALPDARTSDDPDAVAEAKKQLTASRKEVKAVLAAQTARLYEAMCVGREWAAADWRSYLAGHPLLAQIVVRLIWTATDAAGTRTFRPTGDGSLIDATDSDVEVPDDAVVRLTHRTLLDEPAAAAWAIHLADYAVTPLFDQLTNTLPAIPPDATELTNLAGHLTDTFSIRGVSTKRGYQRAPAEDGTWFNEYLKSFPGASLTAVLEFTGSYLPEENLSAAAEKLLFRRRNRVVPLAEVPPVLLAECYADYAALAALGPYDPDYHTKTFF